MNYLKAFEEFNFKDIFKSKEQIGREKLFRTQDLSLPKNEVSIGDKLLCIKNYGYELRYKSLPRTDIFQNGKEYDVIKSDDRSVTIKSDMPHFFTDDDTNTKDVIFLLRKDPDRYFPCLWDYFEKP